ncbi:unnamed protein product, partial [Ixodes hexagonus]
TSSLPHAGKPTVTATLIWTRNLDGSRNAELACVSVSANPSSARWLGRDGTPLITSDSVLVTQSENRYTAKFMNVSEKDYGNYTCVSQNKYGIAMKTVEISGNPTVTATLTWTRNLDGSRNAELVCVSVSANPSRARWLGRDGTPLITSDSVLVSESENSYTAKLMNVSEKDYGNYTCVSQNKYGIAMKSVDISGE